MALEIVGQEGLLSVNGAQAAAVHTFDSRGRAYDGVIVGSYVMPLIRGRITASLSPPSAFWVMANRGPRLAHLRSINVCMGFDGTVSTGTNTFGFQRFRGTGGVGAGATTGTLSPIKKRSSMPTSCISGRFVAGADLGLGDISIEQVGSFLDGDNYGRARQRTADKGVTCATKSLEDIVPFDGFGFDILEPNTMMVIRMNVNASVIGDSLQGCIQWDEVQPVGPLGYSILAP